MAANVFALRKPAPPSPPDEELVGRARAGERAAQEALFRRHLGLVYSLAFKLVGPADSKDIAQDVFFEAFSRFESLREASAFRSWICGITLRLSHRRHRRRRLFGRFFQAQSEDNDVEGTLGREVPADVAFELKQLYALIARFPEKLREVFILHRLEGMTNEETAAAMGVSLTSVKRWLAQADERLDRAKGRGAI